ncbi:hypothetical protein [Nocardia aurantiaca]|uniref:Uncharacterized protein n=1 Tax=Nocardia aurantiaca TaxID=2675850 RepID=A0A6I3KRT2_9NOCA|nr:hypothetical protein [Nocardia aurantiaca]MTE13463.1 hypothetical protein [Nocardia aurantiaca]
MAVESLSTQDRLEELDAGERAVRAAFTLSYQDLPPRRQRLFRRLGLHPGDDFDAPAAAALDNIPVPVARRELGALYVDHLLEETAAGRFRLHDLLRDYARTLVAEDADDDRERAQARLLSYYEHTAFRASRRLARITRLRAVPVDVPPSSVRVFTNAREAARWLRVEQDNLLAWLDHGARQQLSEITMR